MLPIYPPSVLDVYNKKPLTFPSIIDEYCEKIKNACLGLGTNEDDLIDALGPRSANERALIAYRYEELHEESLTNQLKKEVSGDFGYLLRIVCASLPQAEAYALHHAMKGLGTDEHIVYLILMGRSNEEMGILKQTYFEMYGSDLAVDLNNELSGDFKDIILCALQMPLIPYKKDFHTRAKAMQDVEGLYNAGEGKWGTDEGSFTRILLSSPREHIIHLNDIYNEKHEHGLDDAIKSEFSGSDSKALSYFVRLALDPIETIADEIYAAMAGLGTDEAALSTSIVRFHAYLQEAQVVFEKKYDFSMRERINEETSGSYQKLLLSVFDALPHEHKFAK